MTTAELLLTFASSAVVVKALDRGYDACSGWLKNRRSTRDRSRAEQIVERTDSRKLTLEEVGFVITSQQNEIKRLNDCVTQLSKENRECNDKFSALAAEVTELREQAARNGELEERYYTLQVKFQEMLKEMAEFMAGARGVAAKDG